MDNPNASPKCALRGLVVLLALAAVVGGAAREAVADVVTCRSLQVYDPVTGAYDPAALLAYLALLESGKSAEAVRMVLVK